MLCDRPWERYLALRWARAESALRDIQPVPLVIELGAYGRWQREGRKGFIRYLEEGPVWHPWPRGLLPDLLGRPGRVLLLLDGLDEIFDPTTREAVVNGVQRFGSEYARPPVLLTSRVVGYQPARLRDAGFSHFILQDLDSDQIGDFVERWHRETFDDPAQAAPKSPPSPPIWAGTSPAAPGPASCLTKATGTVKSQRTPRRTPGHEESANRPRRYWDDGILPATVADWKSAVPGRSVQILRVLTCPCSP